MPYEHGVPRFVGVVDANAILASADNACRTGWKPRLVKAAETRTANLFAPDHVFDEVYQHMAKVAASSPVPMAVLRAWFEDELLPLVSFVTVPVPEDADRAIQAVADVDADDVPTAVLAKAVAPCIVFSDDRHLKAPGLAPANWREVAGAGADLRYADGDMLAFGLMVSLPFYGVSAGVRLVGRQGPIVSLLASLSIACVLYALLSDEGRRHRIGTTLGPVGLSVLELASDIHTRQDSALGRLNEATYPATANPTVIERVAAVLAVSPAPLLVREVREALARRWPTERLPPVLDLRRAIESCPMFVLSSPHRWQLGRVRAAAS